MSAAGKGDKPRPVHGPTYRANYDAIFRRPMTEIPSPISSPTRRVSEPEGKLPSPGSALPYPDWICRECGWQYGRFPRMDRISAWHEGTCGLCGQRGPVTEPRDFGHLRDLPSPSSQLLAPR